MVSSKQKWGFRALLALLFGLMLLLNFFAPRLADDFHYAYSFATNEKLTSVWDIFPSLEAHTRAMNGRSTPHFLLQLFTMLPDWVFDVLNSGVFVLLIVGMLRLVNGRQTYDILLLCALTGAVFLLVPGFGSSFLWMAGSCNYLWCDVLLIWLLVPFADAVLDRPHRPSLVMQLLMIPAALFFGNMSQNVSAAGAMLMVLSILWLVWKRKPVRWWMVLTALAALAGWYLCLSSPADIGRIKYGTFNFGQILDNFQTAASYMLTHGSKPAMALLILTAISWHEGMDKERLAVIIGLLLAALASNYSMLASIYYPDRAFTGSVLMLICGCAFALPKIARKPLKTALALCLIFGMILHLLHALPDIYDCYAMYNAREAEVYEAVQNGETEWTTYGIDSRSRFDGFHELHDLNIFSDSTINTYYARYHGLESISINRVE